MAVVETKQIPRRWCFTHDSALWNADTHHVNGRTCEVSGILSAAGRHVAAYLENLRFVEGSYGAHLLVEDISEEDVVFGSGGNAPVLTGAGLGITVREELLDKYAQTAIHVR